MADVDINPFGDHDKMIRQDSHPDDKSKTILHNPGGLMGGSTCEPKHEQETSFGGTSLMTEVLREHVEALY